jgi:hypothetical protein
VVLLVHFFKLLQKQVLRLPSACWQELAELWGCHTETFAAAPNKPIVIEPGIMYIANSHAVIHTSHTQNLTKANGFLSCAKCASVVGRGTGKSTAALFFDCLTDERGLWGQFTHEKRLARDLVERGGSSGDVRFLSVKGVRYMIILVNSDTTFAVAEMTNPEASVKLRFMRVEEEIAEDEMGKITLLDWDSSDSALALRILQSNQKYLPPSLVTLNMTFMWL